MKPTKNRIFCHLAKRAKMLFKDEKEAYRFIKFNTSEFRKENKKAPIRVYYCASCKGWHITSKENTNYDQEKDIEVQEEIIDKVIQNYKIKNIKVLSPDEIRIQKIKEINKKLEIIKSGLGKKKYKTYSRETLLTYLENIKEVENLIENNLEISSSRRKGMYSIIENSKEKIIDGFTINIYSEIVGKIDETEKLILYLGRKSKEVTEMMGEVDSDILRLEIKMGKSKYTENLRQRLRNIKEGK